MIHEVDGLEDLVTVADFTIQETLNDGRVEGLGWHDSNANAIVTSGLAGLGNALRSIVFGVEVNGQTKLLEGLHGPSELVAVKDDGRAGSVLAGLRSPHLADNDRLLGTIANNHIILSDLDVRVLANEVGVQLEFDLFTRGVEAGSGLEFGVNIVLMKVSFMNNSRDEGQWEVTIRSMLKKEAGRSTFLRASVALRAREGSRAGSTMGRAGP
jgi:hypothetical protein